MNLHFPTSIVLTLTVLLLLASCLISASYWIASGMTKRTADRKFPSMDENATFENQRCIIPRKHAVTPDKKDIAS